MEIRDLTKLAEMYRNLGPDEESAGYCCKTAFTVDCENLPEEDAF